MFEKAAPAFTIRAMRGLPPSVRWAVRAGVTLAIASWILLRVDVAGVARALRGVRVLPVATALGLYLLGQVMSGWKWSLIGRAVGIERPVGTYVRFYYVGMFFNLFGPSTIGGDLVRGLYLGHGRRRVLALNSVLFDRLSGLALLMAIAAAALVVAGTQGLPMPLVVLVVGGGVGLFVGWWTCPLLVRLLPADNRVRRLVDGDLAPFWNAPDLLFRVAAIAIVFHLMQAFEQYLLALAAGVAVPFTYVLVYHPVVSVMAALPVSIAGIGVREGTYLYFLTRAGWDQSLAVTISLLWFGLGVVSALVGGAVFLASGATLPPLRREPATS